MQAVPVVTSPWRLRLLGAVELLDPAGRPTRLPSRAATLLLARLALAPQRQHPREELTELLWPGVDADTGRNRLRQALSVLRAVLEPAGVPADSVLQADRRAIWLRAAALVCDAHQLQQALRQGDSRSAARWAQGDLLPGHFDEWVLEERSHIASRVEALPQAAPAAAPAPSSWLPQYLTRLIGFDSEGAALAARVAEHRLVLLRGPGGAGKTRLAVEVARALAEPDQGRWADSSRSAERRAFDLVAFVPLANSHNREQMLDSVLHTLRADSGAGPADASQRVCAALAGRRVLLVLDNFEQLVDSARGEIAHWLSVLPQLHLLVTSRRVLGLDGEAEHSLAALPLPTAAAGHEPLMLNPAVALFVDRARAVQRDFVLSEHNQQPVVEIVQALHGLPLAIELAAARLRSLAVSDLQRMLVAGNEPGVTLALLARSGPRGGDDPRHASMLRVLAWSWQQLSTEEQRLLSLLAVCDGGASVQLLQHLVQRDEVDAAVRVDALVASSVAYQRLGHDGDSRFHVFEPMREFVFAHVGPQGISGLRAEHAQAVARWANGLGREPRLDAVAAEWPNLLRAWTSASDPEVPGASAEQAINTVLAARPALDDLMLPPSALAHLRQAAACAPAHRAGLLQALLTQHSLSAGQPEQARDHAQAALAAAAAPDPDRAQVLCMVGRVLLRLGTAATEVQALLLQAQALAEAQGQHDIHARCLVSLAVLRQREHDASGAAVLQAQALQLWQAHGPRARVTEGLVVRAIGLGHLRRVAEQLPLLQQARASAQAQCQWRLLAFVNSVTGYALADLRRMDEAAASYRRCLQMAWDHSSWREWFYALWNLPRTLAHLRQPEAAARLMGFAEAFYAQRFGVLGVEDLPEARRTRRLVAVQLGHAAAAAAWRAGAEMDMRETMALAMRLTEPN
jgi:predicted ATPase